MSYNYDTQGKLESVTAPGGKVYEYKYGSWGRLDQILFDGNEYVTNIDYRKDDLMEKIEYKNGVVTDYTYHTVRKWLTNITTKNKSGGYPLYPVIQI